MSQNASKPVKRRGPGFRIHLIRLLRKWPLVVWLAAAVACYWLFNQSDRFIGMSGVVETSFESVSPVETARLVAIEVEDGQRVKAGDVLARMDTALLEADMAADDARMMEAENTLDRFQQNILQLIRQFEEAIDDAERALQDARQEHARENAELAELKKEQARQEELLAKNLIQQRDLAMLRPQIAALEQSSEDFKEVDRINLRKVEEAVQRRKDLYKALQVDETEDIAVNIATRMMTRRTILDTSRHMQSLQKEAYTLRAVGDGVVSRIYMKPGEVVRAGDVIMRLVSETSEQIWGFLPESHAVALKEGDETTICRALGNAAVAKAVVVSIAPEVQALPSRVSPIRDLPIRGRRVLLNIQGEHDLIPGESVRIFPHRGILEDLRLSFR